MRSDTVRHATLVSLFPLLVSSAILNQQSALVLLVAGQVCSTAGVVTASLVVLLTFPQRRWPTLLVAATLAFKMARVFLGNPPVLLSAYTVASSALTCAAAAVIAIERPRLIHHQLSLICLVSAPLLLCQLLGVSGLTQLLRTDYYAPGNDVTQYATLFVNQFDVSITTLQARPASFFPSNVLLSIVVMFSLAVHYGLSRDRRLSSHDWVLAAVSVLAAAKIIFLTFALIAAWTLLVGGWRRRWMIVKVVLVWALLVGAYSKLFPGVFAYNASEDNATKNFQMRAADFFLATGVAPLVSRAYQFSDSVWAVGEDPNDRQSGYAVVARAIPYLAGAAVVVAPIYLLGLGRIRRQSKRLGRLVVLALFVMGLAPLVTSFLGAQIYWFIGGFALLPLVVQIEPQYRRLFVKSIANARTGPRVASSPAAFNRSEPSPSA